MGITNIPCPNECKIIDEKTKEEKIGLLFEVQKESGRYFCQTPGCTFAFIDEKGNEHWMGIGIKSRIVEKVEEKPLITS